MTKPEGRVGPLIFTLTYLAGFFGGAAIILTFVVKLPWAAMFFATLGIFVMTVVALLYEQSRKLPPVRVGGPMQRTIVVEGKDAERILDTLERNEAGNGVGFRHG